MKQHVDQPGEVMAVSPGSRELLRCLTGSAIATNPLICLQAAEGAREKIYGCFDGISDGLGRFMIVFCQP